MKRIATRSKAIGLVSALLMVAGAAMAQDFSEVIDNRQQNFLSIADTFKSLKKAEDGSDSDWEIIRNLAIKNADTVGALKGMFPEGSSFDSRSKPAVWTKWDKFESGLDGLQTSFVSMADAAVAQDDDALEAAIKSADRSCKACHRGFRTKR
ncbi:cytochrome c [Grimontia kaedaensis]|uniref:Cytochrome c n=1 Tax=Grimontia kaedaensis TaxID=2872157 RepID=A0ABY4WV34_9GAMM|nr:cytochrome c [Grimontia kaedaensis]USH03459.1 cytochrome c [Grimontia kaedaensis]